MKICVTITTRGNYSKLKSVMDCINADPDLELQVIAGGEAVLPKYGNIIKDLKPDRIIPYIVDGETPLTMAKSSGLALIEFATAFSDLAPDVVLVVGDRFDTLAIVMAATYSNIPVAHIEGGEVSGSIDESIRHAITKMSHIHFPATDDAALRIIEMGEDPESVYMVGATSLDVTRDIDYTDLEEYNHLEKISGVGGRIAIHDDYIVVLYHPVTTECDEAHNQVEELCKAVLRCDYQTIWIWPHSDAGSDGVSKAIREFREKIPYNYPIRFFKSLPLEMYLSLLKESVCLVGNSSSGIREASFLGVPVVNIGSRQDDRERAENVIDVLCTDRDISDGIFKQYEHGHYSSDYTYGDGNSGRQIVDILKNKKIAIQKRYCN